MSSGDMLVKLYDLPETVPGLERLNQIGIQIKRAMPHNKHRVLSYVEDVFGKAWASECDGCFARQPVSCFIALDGDTIVGFACYETTALDFFGPTGVSEAYRGKGIGKALFLKCLLAMREMGYGYAIIGGVDDAEGFYVKTVNAIPIPDSFPGVYANAIGIEKSIARRAAAEAAREQGTTK